MIAIGRGFEGACFCHKLPTVIPLPLASRATARGSVTNRTQKISKLNNYQLPALAAFLIQPNRR